MAKHDIAITVNGQSMELEVSSSETLAELIRQRLRLTGTKVGCGTGSCGSCAVLVDGRLKNSCLTLAAIADGASIITIEGLSTRQGLNSVQRSFVENGAIQCGFCTPAMVLAAVALLSENRSPDDCEIAYAISGNLCRCTGYTKIIKAIKEAALAMSGEAAVDGARTDAIQTKM